MVFFSFPVFQCHLEVSQFLYYAFKEFKNNYITPAPHILESVYLLFQGGQPLLDQSKFVFQEFGYPRGAPGGIV